MTDVESINEQLRVHGLNLKGEPLYRVVWSDFQTEMRYGRFREFLGKLFLREFVGTKECPKYNFLSERWVLERWLPPELVYTPELPNSSQGSYEPIYVFQDKNGNYLPPNLKAAEFVVGRAENPTHVTPEERMNEKDEIERKEIEHYMDALEISSITNALHMKEAVGYSKEIKKQ